MDEQYETILLAATTLDDHVDVVTEERLKEAYEILTGESCMEYKFEEWVGDLVREDHLTRYGVTSGMHYAVPRDTEEELDTGDIASADVPLVLSLETSNGLATLEWRDDDWQQNEITF
jgi:hypothetical protein